MFAESQCEDAAREPVNGVDFLEKSCLPFLRSAQNADGGWGYRPGLQSTVEPTAWAVLALREQEVERTTTQAVDRATAWLQKAQRPDGAWPVTANAHPGCWLTALACLALLKQGQTPDSAVTRGLHWLCNTWPAEGNLIGRLRQRWLKKTNALVRQDHSLRAWGWTPGTANWVEPTCFALILLRNVPEQSLPSTAAHRMRQAELMLYDRMCPGGGWSAGNPLVYGVAGAPMVSSTAWALLALRDNPARTENKISLEWLNQGFKTIQGCGSLALAHLCLKSYGSRAESPESRLYDLYGNNHFLQSVVAASWVILALGGLPEWLGGSSPRQEGMA